MATTYSPLRYPGGKASLQDQVAEILKLNRLQYGHYAEPYAGGCGLALSMLYRGYVSDVHVNDVDLGIWSFWHCVLTDIDRFVDRMVETPVTLQQWHRQREVQTAGATVDPLDLGFATFFLNRTNRSGIIKNAGVIGGKQQTGNYLIDCRFNKAQLEKRLRRVARYCDRIHLTRMDALDFLDHVDSTLPEDTLCYIDPPYYGKGSKLYTSYYDESDHAEVATRVLQLNCPWILTYDNVAEIRRLYKPRRQFQLSLYYSAQEKRVGSELLIASKRLRLPESIKANLLTKRHAEAA